MNPAERGSVAVLHPLLVGTKNANTWLNPKSVFGEIVETPQAAAAVARLHGAIFTGNPNMRYALSQARYCETRKHEHGVESLVRLWCGI